MSPEICVKEVIVSFLTRKGKGEGRDPVRIITEVFEKDGTKIAEYDPCLMNDLFVSGDLVNFARWCISSNNTTPAYSDVDKWLESLEKTR